MYRQNGESNIYELEEGLDSKELEYDSEFEQFIEGEQDSLGEIGISENEENELVDELLSVSNDQEMEYFLGKLFKKVVPAAKRFLKSPTFKKLGGMLKNVAKKALPAIGTAVGTYYGQPQMGAQLGSMASNLFELELEGVPEDELEFEVGKRFVKLAGEAAKNAINNLGQGDPKSVAKNALYTAAKKYAPGIAKLKYGESAPINISNSNSGTWIRRGSRIILMGV